jgi:hypothetical protein
VLYYVTKQVLPVLSRAFIVQDVDVWKWFNELPLQSLKQCCFPKTNLFSVERCDVAVALIVPRLIVAFSGIDSILNTVMLNNYFTSGSDLI